MDKTSFLYAGLLLLGTFIGAISQVMLKKAAQRHYDAPLAEYLNPLVVGAYVLFVGTTLMGVLAYRGIPLSMGPVLESTSYLYVTFFGACFFGEKVTPKKLLALALILGGIAVYACWG